MADDYGASMRNNAVYEALRVQGASKETAARIADARAVGESSSQTGGRQSPNEECHHDEHYERARKVGIHGRSDMDTSSLVDALRNY